MKKIFSAKLLRLCAEKTKPCDRGKNYTTEAKTNKVLVNKAVSHYVVRYKQNLKMAKKLTTQNYLLVISVTMKLNFCVKEIYICRKNQSVWFPKRDKMIHHCSLRVVLCRSRQG